MDNMAANDGVAVVVHIQRLADTEVLEVHTAIVVQHIELLCREWPDWIRVLVKRPFHQSLDSQMRRLNLVEEPLFVGVDRLAEHIESMELHKLACEPDFGIPLHNWGGICRKLEFLE